MEKLLHPPVTVKLISFSPAGIIVSAAAARITVSRKSFEEALKGLDVEVWMRELVSRSHGSPLEHSTYTFEATCSRVCSHQLVRHRLASYTQQSMRVTDAFLRKTVLRLCGLAGVECPSKPRRPEDYELYSRVARTAAEMVLEGRYEREIVDAASIGFSLNPFKPLRVLVKRVASLLRSLADYYEALSTGEPFEDARFLIPCSVRTRIVFTMNARELFESFIPLRTCIRAQWEIRLLAWGVRELVNRVHPQLFKYSGPRCVVLDAVARASEPCSLEDYVKGVCSFTIAKCPEKVVGRAIPFCLRASYEMFRRYVEAYPEAVAVEVLSK